ncbi:hypothetical protein ZIOFF_048855 [Zingiber officinale]|uniref:CCHC-type domain-containing protein n=1 Tax=Zingiber officinale TaxID=94328 RepID=A0A8J5FX94_ZINOF|nr:hypothetical protein ZIOFF_048855 [Zingiber officinale]
MTSSNPLTFFTYSPSQIPIFEGEHYEYWSSQMETIFISQDLWDVVKQEFETVAEEETEKQLKENIKKNATALRIIQQGVSKSIYPRIFGMKSAQEAWDVLKKEFKGAHKVISIKLQNYWRNFDNLSMKENESVKDFSSRVAEIVNQIKGCGDTISEKKVVERILRSLPQKFEHIVAVIEETKDKSQLTRYELFNSLEAHEGRVNGYTNQPLEQVFQVKANLGEKKSDARQEERGFSSSYRGSSSRRRGGSGQNHGRGYGRKPSLDVQRSGTECQICKKPGHESKSCWHRCTRCKISNHSKRDCWFKEKAEAADAKANFAKENDVEKLFYSSIDSEHSYKETWFLDSGCSHHITGNRDSFAMLDDKFSTQVELGDSKRVSIEGQGVVAASQKEDGYKLIFDNDRCDIINKKNNLRVAAVKMNANGLFPFETGKLQTYALKCGDLDESYLWHLRYRHLNFKSLQLLEQKGMVTGLPTIHSKDRVCEGCIYRKMHRFPFPKTAWRARSPLELVHVDICGPIRSASLGNKQYFILFVDDFTRMIWTYFLDRKSDAFSTFLHFKALVENQMPVLSDGAGTIPFADVAGPTAGTQSRMEGESLSTEGESSSTTAPTDDSESDSPQSPNEPSLYVKVGEKGNFLIVCLYVDDVIYTGTDIKMVEDFKLAMMKKFEMSNLGLMRYFLGFQVKQSSGEIFISQEKYVEDLLKKFQMLSCKPVPTPMALNEKLQQEDDSKMADEKLYRSLVGSLIYLTNTRPDIVQPVSVLSRFMSKPSKVHYAAAKRVLRFLQGTMKHGLRYVKESNNDLVGFTDSDWAGSLEDRRSTSAYLFCFGSKVISWSSRKQNTVALSSPEAEYSAATSAACEAVWLRRIMADLQQKHTCSTTIFCDNMSAIAMTKNPVFHARSKHIELCHHFIRDLVNKREIHLEFIEINEQPADVLTKPVSLEKLEKFKDKMKITN